MKDCVYRQKKTDVIILLLQGSLTYDQSLEIRTVFRKVFRVYCRSYL